MYLHGDCNAQRVMLHYVSPCTGRQLLILRPSHQTTTHSSIWTVNVLHSAHVDSVQMAPPSLVLHVAICCHNINHNRYDLYGTTLATTIDTAFNTQTFITPRHLHNIQPTEAQGLT